MAKKTPSGADMAPTLYTVLEPLRHDGTDHQVGDSIELTEDVAAALLAAKSIALPFPELIPPKD